MAKKKRGRRGGSKKIPLAVVAPMAVVGYKIAKEAMTGATGQNMAVLRLTGWDAGSTTDNFKPNYLIGTYVPVLAGVIVHKGASRLGVNRMIPKWLPFNI